MLLEANPFLAAELRRKRKRDLLIEVACSDTHGTRAFHLFDTWQLSTFDPVRLENLRNDCVTPSSTIALQVITLGDLNC